MIIFPNSWNKYWMVVLQKIVDVFVSLDIQFMTNCDYPTNAIHHALPNKVALSKRECVFVWHQNTDIAASVWATLNSPSNLKCCLPAGRKWHICPPKDQLYAATATLTAFRTLICNIFNMYLSLSSIFICSALLHPTASWQLAHGNAAEPSSLVSTATGFVVAYLCSCVFFQSECCACSRVMTRHPAVSTALGGIRNSEQNDWPTAPLCLMSCRLAVDGKVKSQSVSCSVRLQIRVHSTVALLCQTQSSRLKYLLWYLFTQDIEVLKCDAFLSHRLLQYSVEEVKL